MADLSRLTPAPQPGPGNTATLAPSGPPPVAGPERRRPTVLEAERRTADERILIELRRKVQSGELLSAATERLLWKMNFNGHLTILVQNGRVLKTGYEEGYFRRRSDLGGFLVDI